MDWNLLLNSNRLGKTNTLPGLQKEDRTEFQRDFDRIIFSSPFRRLQGKTQVFPLPGRVFVHNRLTHSLEVASIGRSLGNMVSQRIISEQKTDPNLAPITELGFITSVACLCHDLGNPPFGHSGEKAIAHFFRKGNGKSLENELKPSEWLDITNFEGNANVLRLLTHQFYGRRQGGYNLTYASLASLIKYPFHSNYGVKHCKNRYGYFTSEQSIFEEIAGKTGLTKLTTGVYYRHPLAFLVEAADDISYQIMDIEDAQKLAVISYEQASGILFSFLKETGDKKLLEKIDHTFKIVTDKNEQIAYLRSLIINKLTNQVAEIFMQQYNNILQGKSSKPLVDYFAGETGVALERCKDFAIENIYNHRSVIEIELAGYNVLGTILEEFISAVLEPNSHYAKKIYKLVPNQYISATKAMYSKIQSILDFISGMTDNFALELYRDIKGISTY